MSPQEFIQKRSANSAIALIDVRSPAEFRSVHADGAVNLPLEKVSAESVKQLAGDREVVLICQSGVRSRSARNELNAAGLKQVDHIEGGTQAWENAGLAVIKGKGVISIERQVRIGAGLIVLCGVILGWTVSNDAYLISGMVGAGLIISGITGFCGMAKVIARMPWNR